MLYNYVKSTAHLFLLLLVQWWMFYIVRLFIYNTEAGGQTGAGEGNSAKTICHNDKKIIAQHHRHLHAL